MPLPCTTSSVSMTFQPTSAVVPEPSTEGQPGPGSAPADPAPAPRPTSGSIESTAVRSQLGAGTPVGLTIATVGSETIGLGELKEAVNEYIRVHVPKDQKLRPEDRTELYSFVLEGLIDRCLLVQEAKRVLLKSDKQQQAFSKYVDDQWKAHEVPKLIRQFGVKSERELRVRLEEQGRSLELMRDRFRRETMAQEYLSHHLHARLVPPEGPQIWAYYQEHLDDFQLPAKITWREIVVKVGPKGDRIAARVRAEQLLDRLRRGEDFATLARQYSHGSTAAEGGLWQTEPDAAAVPAVNAALRSQPLNQISSILEGPSSFHIVRIEARRQAGPASFYEVQNKIRNLLQEQMFQNEVNKFTTELRDKTIITYHLRDAGRPRRDDQTKPARTP